MSQVSNNQPQGWSTSKKIVVSVVVIGLIGLVLIPSTPAKQPQPTEESPTSQTTNQQADRTTDQQPETTTVDPDTQTTLELPETQQNPETSPNLALDWLGQLVIAQETPAGYDRNLFKHWVDANGDGCDTRKEVLIAEAVVKPTIGASCRLFNGSWLSLYDGRIDQDTGSGFDVDHLVPLAEAWQSGAKYWSANKRQLFANDLGYQDSLIAVSASSNRSKGARDPAGWLPPKTDSHCWYVSAWVAVKRRWSLNIDQTEYNQLLSIINNCGGLVTSPPAPDEIQSEANQPIPQPVITPPAGQCQPAYPNQCLAIVDDLNCGDIPANLKPVTGITAGNDPYRLDSDKDGVGCEGG